MSVIWRQMLHLCYIGEHMCVFRTKILACVFSAAYKGEVLQHRAR